MAWSEAEIPDQSGKTVLVTGANSGLGLRTAEVLASKGARVLLACRSLERGAAALEQVRSAATGPEPEMVQLDLADLSSVKAAAAQVRQTTDDHLDVLVNNAGVMAVPKAKTVDGFERQFGTNHVGHAALTALLLPALRKAGTTEKPARVVTVSSVAAARGRIDADDPNFEHRRYNPGSSYGQSKLANQVFAMELDERLRAADEPIISVAAHPGYTATNLGSNMAGGYPNKLVSALVKVGNRIGEMAMAQGVEAGAQPQIYAATMPDVDGGDYIGAGGFQQMRGAPAKVRPLRPARDPLTRERLWDITWKMTGIAPDIAPRSR